MDRGLRIAAACGVLLSGVAVALLFRHQSPRSGPPVPGTSDPLVLRRHVNPQASGPSGPGGGPGSVESSDSGSTVPSAAGQAPTVVTPMDHGEPPPDLVREYPAGDTGGTGRWGASIGLDLLHSPRPAELMRTHTIVDGDTLGALAQRYLDSADCELEIYEANRDVLSSPRLLPIGASLKIPPRRSQPTLSSPVVPGDRLVPIRRGEP